MTTFILLKDFIYINKTQKLAVYATMC